MPWEKVVPVADLEKKPVLFKSSPKQIALFKVGEQIFAVDNRCPHEGYPLVEGNVDDQCVLTCNWHNWKFQLEDGKCILGGDNVRRYDVERRDNHVWVNTDDPPQAEVQASILDGLEVSFQERDFGRICREITRLHFNGLDPLVAVHKAIQWSYNRLEFGFTHAYAASADWLALAAEFDGDWDRQLVCLAETVDHMSFDSLRHREYPFAEPGGPFDADRFIEAVEAEDRLSAEAMVRRGLSDDLHWCDMEEAFAEAALAHYNDFGHSIIYVYKTTSLVKKLGSDVEPFLLPSLARHLCYTTREDLLPEFKHYGIVLPQTPPYTDQNGPPLDPESLFPVTTKNQAIQLVKRDFG